ncbi:MAG: hypothetical protein RL220_306 [Bacteroidota bacterium]|jgi:integral membrane protein
MNQDQLSALKRFRNISIIEGFSFLILLFIAMPLKRFAGIPMAVTVVGWAHGILFIAYILFLAETHFACKWSVGRSFWAMVASLVPFGTFYFDKKIIQPVLNK